MANLGAVEFSVPRTRRFCPTEVPKSYAKRAPEIEGAILAGFVLGLSARKVGEVLLALLGCKISATTMSRVCERARNGIIGASAVFWVLSGLCSYGDL